MKIYLHEHSTGVYLLNEDCTAFCRPYFITHPTRTLILRKKGLSKEEVLFSVTDDELEEMANNCLLKWRELLPLMVDEYGELDGWAPKPIATAYIK